jgi:hypothetical protein
MSPRPRRNAGGDQRLVQMAARRNAQAAVLQPRARVFSAQKLVGHG